MTTHEDLAWAAGFFDAEGCFSGAGPTPHARATQVHLEPLDVFANTVGIGTLKGPYEKATAAIKRKPQWIYYCYGKTAENLFDILQPWLGSYRADQGQRMLGRRPPHVELQPFDQWAWTEKVAWSGGLFEGEGCFSRAGRSLTSRIGNTDVELLHRFEKAIGIGHIYGPYYSESMRLTHRKPQWVYTTSGFAEMQAILGILWPWLSSRRRLKATDLLGGYLTIYPGCGHARENGRWHKHCPRCFHPGPKPGLKQRQRLMIDGQGSLDIGQTVS